MKYIIILVMLLAGCSTTVPVQRTFPDVPKPLMVKCPELSTIEGNAVSISDLLKVVVKNYTSYHQCAITTESWIFWYNSQKSIFDSVK
jgi:hypothetical protein